MYRFQIVSFALVAASTTTTAAAAIPTPSSRFSTSRPGLRSNQCLNNSAHNLIFGFLCSKWWEVQRDALSGNVFG